MPEKRLPIFQLAPPVLEYLSFLDLNSRMELDKFDLAILAALQQDARASLQDISARVGLSTTPCWTRIKKMESAGVILGYSVRIDPAAVGFTETVIVQVTLESHTDEILEAFGKALAEIPEVMEAYLHLRRLRLLHPHRRARHARL